ncbi:MAG: transporter related protein [Verrucomicrobiales bacterium]|nr:transporter related protein [Verrucomicrobiales bacterium]
MGSAPNKSSQEKPFLRRLFNAEDKSAPDRNDYLPVPEGTLFHVTHWKAGSQWVRAILEDLYGPAVVAPQSFEAQVLTKPIEAKKVYMCVYVSKPEMSALVLPPGTKHFVLIRDLRDTLISAYFSIRQTHEVTNPVMAKWRNILTKLNEEEGLLYLMEVWLNLCGVIQRTWLDSGEKVFRLEDCMANAKGTVSEMFQKGWGITLDPKLLESVLARHSFQKLSGGRERGSEDTKSHYRKGVHGDWQNHFTPRIKSRFKSLYNDLLLMGGYEKDSNW